MIIRLIRVLIVFYIFVGVAGCGSSKSEIENTVEDVLKIDVPSQFVVIEDDKWAGIGDLSFTYVIEFGEADFNALLSSLDLNAWEEVSPGYYDYKTDSHKGVIITLLVKEKRLRYFYFD